MPKKTTNAVSVKAAAGAGPAGTVLLTGFAPFDKDPINCSWEVARSLNGVQVRSPAGKPAHATVVARQIPCEFNRAREVLAAHIKRLDPDWIVLLGQANSRIDISLERVAININDARIADNAGAKPVDTAVIADAPVGYFSLLPIKSIVQAVRAAGIPASVSQTAGTYVCNHLFFGLMHLLATQYPGKRGGLIHLPPLPVQAARIPGTPSLGLDTMREAVQIAIATALSVRRDRRISEGAID